MLHFLKIKYFKANHSERFVRTRTEAEAEIIRKFCILEFCAVKKNLVDISLLERNFKLILYN
jgi:hypothetical protein